MKVLGADWRAFTDSWPKGWYYDDSDETVNGNAFYENEIPSAAVVEFTCGVICDDADDDMQLDLVREYRRWAKARFYQHVVCEVPKEKLKEFAVAVRAMGGKVL
jgi:hypothetical protein